jgi:small subunit ribosomal protein S8
MSLNDPLADALSQMNNAEIKGKKEVHITPFSKLFLKILTILKEKGYVKDFKVEKDAKGDSVLVTLSHTINKIGVIKPRFPVKVEDIQKYEERYLPAKDFGIVFVSTNHGLMTHNDAKEKNMGGKVIAYCY